MAIINKPELDSIWASEGAKTKPPLDKIKQGWISEIPPHQYENWIQNKQDEFNAYVNQKGIPEWDGVTEYYKDKSFVQDNKKIYVSVRDSGGSLAISKQPSLDVAGEYWKVVSFSSDELKQTTGQSTKDIMSQKAVTDAIDNSATGKADKTVSINAGSGLLGGGNLSTSRTLSVNYGTTAGASAQGNDSRFAQGVAAFGWGNHALAGYSKTDTTYYVGEGLTQTGFRFDVKFGTTLGSVMQGNDSRVVNAVPKERKVLAGTGLNGGGNLEDDRTFSVKYGNTAGTAVEGNDARFNQPYSQMFGIGQSWKNVTVSRVNGLTYTNATGRPIVVSVNFKFTPSNDNIRFYVDEVDLMGGLDWGVDTYRGTFSYIVPNGSTYRMTHSVGSILGWFELR